MKVSVKIDREGKNLTGISDDIRKKMKQVIAYGICLLYTSPSPRDIS